MQHSSQANLGGELTVGGLRPGEAEGLAVELAGIEPWLTYVREPSELLSFFVLDEPSAPRYALRQNNDLVGFAVVRMNWLRGPYVQFLGLLPGFQRQGLGARFLDWVEECAAVDGHRNVWIMVSDFNANARAFYARQGYQEVSAVTDAVKDGLTEILLRKRV